MSFWGDFDLIRKYVVLRRFSKLFQKKCRFGEIFGYQERPKFLLYIKIKKHHFGEIWALYFSTMKILGKRIVVDIRKSVVSTATAIRNLDSKQKNVILERFWGHNFLTIRIIL